MENWPRFVWCGSPAADIRGLSILFFLLSSLDIYRLFNTVEDSPMRTTGRATGVDKLLPNGDNMF